MSGCEVDLLFKQCKSFEDAFDVIFSFTSKIKSDKYALDYLNKVIIFSPTITSLYEHPRLEDELSVKKEDKDWLDGAFSFQFVYWKEYKLLGLLFNPQYLPEGLKEDGFFDSYVFFHNNEVEGYNDFRDFGDKVDIFNKIIKDCISLKEDDIIEEGLKICYGDDIDEEELKEYDNRDKNYDFCLNAVCYDRIREALDIASIDALKESTDKYRKYTISAIDCGNTKRNLIPPMFQAMKGKKEEIHQMFFGDN